MWSPWDAASYSPPKKRKSNNAQDSNVQPMPKVQHSRPQYTINAGQTPPQIQNLIPGSSSRSIPMLSYNGISRNVQLVNSTPQLYYVRNVAQTSQNYNGITVIQNSGTSFTTNPNRVLYSTQMNASSNLNDGNQTGLFSASLGQEGVTLVYQPAISPTTQQNVTSMECPQPLQNRFKQQQQQQPILQHPQTVMGRRLVPVTITPHGFQPLKSAHVTSRFIVPNVVHNRTPTSQINGCSTTGNGTPSSNQSAIPLRSPSVSKIVSVNNSGSKLSLHNNTSEVFETTIPLDGMNSEIAEEVIPTMSIIPKSGEKTITKRALLDSDSLSSSTIPRREVYDCARFIPVYEVWRMLQSKKNEEILTRFESSRMIYYMDWRLHKEKQKKRASKKIFIPKSQTSPPSSSYSNIPTPEPCGITKSVGLADSVKEDSIICVEDMLLKEKIDDIVASYLSPKKRLQKAEKAPKKVKIKEIKSKKILKSAKRNSLNVLSTAALMSFGAFPATKKRRFFAARTLEEERQILHRFEQEGLDNEQYFYLHKAWCTQIKRKEKAFANIEEQQKTKTKNGDEETIININNQVDELANNKPKVEEEGEEEIKEKQQEDTTAKDSKILDQIFDNIPILDIPWVSLRHDAFYTVPITTINERDALPFNKDTFENFVYKDSQLNDVIPLPSGSARTEGFFRPSQKRKIHDHRVRRLKCIQEIKQNSGLSGANSLVDAFITNGVVANPELMIMDDRQVKHKILTPLINKSAERFLADKEKSTPMVHSTMHLQHLLHKSAQNPFSLADNSLEPIRKAVFEKFRQKELKFCRSSIHGWGLYAKENIGADELIIEYVGEKIRHSIADVREIKYEKSGIGSSYMFKIDDELVVDATYSGNYARFINHCCKPNCYAKIVALNGTDKRIFIYSKTPIEKGEELTYDYKFDREEASKRVPCFCYTKGCRKFLN